MYTGVFLNTGCDDPFVIFSCHDLRRFTLKSRDTPLLSATSSVANVVKSMRSMRHVSHWIFTVNIVDFIYILHNK